ncbi:uncharacterized protein LOC142175837 [Nicotiana tabacum]|uniref:Uncharacterized protein LOC142175837 n=1 Tax=Nicotiana tabacum TaxID=4097 RepID=A0AC58TP11_TOBAC
MVKKFFNGKELPKYITHTNLVLLPKKKDVITFSDMRPISLSNFINKVFSRVIHETIAPLLPSLISSKITLWFFKSTRGVKQGDPLSPTLFILSAKALSSRLNALHQNLYFCLVWTAKMDPKINNLSYADDTIIFSSSDATSLRLIMEVLMAYESASGQLINKVKSAVYMHHLTDMEVVNKV